MQIRLYLFWVPEQAGTTDIRPAKLWLRGQLKRHPLQRDWTERKCAMWERSEKLPSQKPSSLMRCPCGEIIFDSHRLEHTLIHVPHITATVDNETYH
jgi:hypothetical protein